jgi:hypothetical protein
MSQDQTISVQQAYGRELIEEQLAHQVGAVEGAYLRVSAVERRLPIMKGWAAFFEGHDKSATSANILPLKSSTGFSYGRYRTYR